MAAYQNALDALADQTRRAIFESLRRRPQAVGEVARRVPVSRPAVSQHLRVLREAGLVTVERDGTRSVYSIDPRGLQHLREYLDSFWVGVLGSFKESVERDRGDKRKAKKNGGR